MPDHKEQRQHERIPCEVDAGIYILAPDETFSPYPLHGKIMDLSFAGLGLCISPMPRAVFQMLLRGRRLVRVLTRLPGNDSESRFFGTVVWIDFNQKSPHPVCRIGMSLDPARDANQHDLRQAMAHLKGFSTAAPKPLGVEENPTPLNLSGMKPPTADGAPRCSPLAAAVS